MIRRRSLLLALLAGGCTELLPGRGPLPNLYVLSPKSSFAPDLPTVKWQLAVEEPIASGGLDTQQIALANHPLEIEYFAQARWTERAPQMVQTLMVESFENSKRIVAVGRQALSIRADYTLQTDLREFQAEYFGGAKSPMAHVRLNTKLIKHPRREIVASQGFAEKVPAASNEMRAIIAAFDDALGKVLRRLVEWTLVTAP
jgi:cholesterol transport system auxiliary component